MTANRRDFLRILGSVGAGALFFGRGIDARGQSSRDVRIDGQDAIVVDIHAHCVFLRELEERLPDAMPAGVGLPDLLPLGPIVSN